MGTAASFALRERAPYADNDLGDNRSGRALEAYGNEGFNLDPPLVISDGGEMAGLDSGELIRTAVHPRHAGKGSVLCVDSHASVESLESLGYRISNGGVVTFDGDNRRFSLDNSNVAWTEKEDGRR